MSTGGFLGAAIGGVLGFFIGGPMGALYGASIGFSLGMMVDPMSPDMPTTGTPLPMGADVMINTVGDPLPDLTGTAKITGHLLFYGKERTVPVEQEQEGGKGGGSPDPTVTGYEYYMSWGVGIVTGPISTLYAIYKGDDVVWEGELDLPLDSDAYGQETIVLTGHGPPITEEEGSILDPPEEEAPSVSSMGSVTFYFGTDDQIANPNVDEIIGDSTLNSPYRNFCWCFFDDCYIGSYNRCPTMKFVLRKSPTNAFSGNNVIQIYDHNPMHVAWYALHNLAGLPEEWLHTADFAAAAATLAGENRGICCFFDKQQSTLDYLQAINGHIDGLIRYGSDGKFHPKLIRDDYTVAGLPLIDENVMLDDPTFSRKAWGDTVNEMKVQYTEIIGKSVYTYGILGVGYNLFGQLGVGDRTVRYEFTSAIEGTSEYQLACAEEAVLIVKKDGTLWGTGLDSNGQLGLGEGGDDYYTEFTQIGTDTNWAKVFSGYEQTFAIKTNRTLWATGKNERAQAGVGHANKIYELVQVGTDTDWDMISVGATHSIAIKTNGTLWGAGHSSCFGSGFDNWEYAFVQVGTDTWTAISADYYCTLGIKSDGTLWGVGDNLYGELGLGEGSENWWFDDFTQIGIDTDWAILQPTFGNSSFAIKINGTLWATGQNDRGQLGLNDTTARYVHNQVGTDTDWVKIVNGSGYYSDHSMAIKTDGTMYGSGNNNYGRLGIADKIDKHVFTKVDLDYDWQDVGVGASFTIAIRRYVA